MNSFVGNKKSTRSAMTNANATVYLLAIYLEGYPKHLMDQKSSDVIRKTLRSAMLEMENENLLLPDGEKEPDIILTTLRLQHGQFVIGCGDDNSKLWLETIVANYNWKNTGINPKVLIGDARKVYVAPTYLIVAPPALS